MLDLSDIYNRQVPAEIIRISAFLSAKENDLVREYHELKKHANPFTLYDLLRNHRLYPSFYKRWQTIPHEENNDAGWELFGENIKKLAERNRMQMLQKTGALVQIVKHFNENGIPVIALKGPALARQIHSDVAMKASIDLDLLIPQEYFKKASAALGHLGFQPDFPYTLTIPQERYLLRNFHHLPFTNSQTPLELHWEVNTNKYMAGRSIGEYFEHIHYVEIASVQVPVLSPLYLTEYLMIHGSYHGWARLDWLYDFSKTLELYPSEMEKLKTFSAITGNEKMLHQTSFLSHLLFRTPLINTEPIKPLLIEIPLKQIAQPYVATKQQGITRFRQKYYLYQLKKGWKYRMHIFNVLGTNLGDWECIKFPGRLFFMYFLLRPVMYLLRFFKTPG